MSPLRAPYLPRRHPLKPYGRRSAPCMPRFFLTEGGPLWGMCCDGGGVRGHDGHGGETPHRTASPVRRPDLVFRSPIGGPEGPPVIWWAPFHRSVAFASAIRVGRSGHGRPDEVTGGGGGVLSTGRRSFGVSRVIHPGPAGPPGDTRGCHGRPSPSPVVGNGAPNNLPGWPIRAGRSFGSMSAMPLSDGTETITPRPDEN